MILTIRPFLGFDFIGIANIIFAMLRFSFFSMFLPINATLTFFTTQRCLITGNKGTSTNYANAIIFWGFMGNIGMKIFVFLRDQYDEIRKVIVSFIAINMMNLFIGPQEATKGLFHYVTMFVYKFSAMKVKYNITFSCFVSSALPSWVRKANSFSGCIILALWRAKFAFLALTTSLLKIFMTFLASIGSFPSFPSGMKRSGQFLSCLINAIARAKAMNSPAFKFLAAFFAGQDKHKNVLAMNTII